MANPNTPVFPSALATDLDLMVAGNRALSKLSSPIDASQTQIAVVDGTKFQYPCLVQIDTEIIRVGSISGNNLMSCTRGFSSSQAIHGQFADVKGYVLAYHHNQIAAEIQAIETSLGVNLENIRGTLSSQTGLIDSLATTDLIVFPDPGIYRLCAYATVTTADSSGSLSLSFGWNDGTDVRTNVVITALDTSATNFGQGFSVAKVASGNITYTTTLVKTDNPVYNVDVTAERVQ